MNDGCQVDFYVLGSAEVSARELACRLCLMAWEQGHRVSVLAGDEAEADELDSLMWDYPPGRFLPHDRPPENRAPVRIVARCEDLADDRDLVVNLARDPVPEPTRFRRLLEIVPMDDGRREAAREKFRHYRAQGLRPDNHDITKL